MEFIQGVHLVKVRHQRDSFYPSYPLITTMTCELDTGSSIDLDKFKCFIGLGCGCGSWQIKKSEKETFKNQISLTRETGGRNQAALVFKNGRLKIAGLCDEIDRDDVIFQFEGLFSNFFGIPVKFENSRFSLINAKVALNRRIDFARFAEFLEKLKHREDFYASRMNFDRSPAITFVLKVLEKNITFCCFSTGVIMIQGANTIKNLTTAYDHLLKIFGDNLDLLGDPSKQFQKLNIFRGYEIESLFSASNNNKDEH